MVASKRGQWYPPQASGARSAPVATQGGGCLKAIGIAALVGTGLVAVFVVLAVAASLGHSKRVPATPAKHVPATPAGPFTISDNEANPPQGDVVLDSCKVDDLKMLKASGRIVNHSSKASNYIVHVSFIDGTGTRVADGLSVENEVTPGQTATWDAWGFKEVSPPITCQVTSVERFSARG